MASISGGGGVTLTPLLDSVFMCLPIHPRAVRVCWCEGKRGFRCEWEREKERPKERIDIEAQCS